MFLFLRWKAYGSNRMEAWFILPVPSRTYIRQNGNGPHRNNIELGRYGRNRTNVWEYAGANGFDGRKTDEGDLLSVHPTVKPVQMIADALLDSSKRGEKYWIHFSAVDRLSLPQRVKRPCTREGSD